MTCTALEEVDMNCLSWNHRLVLAAAILTFTIGIGAHASPLDSGQSSQTAPAQNLASGKYVGADACKTCHEEEFKGIEGTRHWDAVVKIKGGLEAHSCEGCHGPGAAHAEDADPKKIFSFKTASSKEINQRCLACHSSGQDHMNFSRSAHSENNLSCLSCHSSHHAIKNQFLLIKAQPSLCYSCHLNVKPQFNMPFHHRVEEGLVKCSDCHSPHGSFVAKQLRSAAARDSVCFTCHVDKQGPFVFEHQAVKTEGCEACHAPHGSPNQRLLKTSNLNVLCLSCHTASTFSSATGTPDFHNQAVQYQACTICHAQIHGSNFDRHLLK
jgi:DmsE family decaheme c-type cytochrome